MKSIIAIAAALCIFTSSCSTLIEKAMDADWMTYSKDWKNHPNPANQPTK